VEFRGKQALHPGVERRRIVRANADGSQMELAAAGIDAHRIAIDSQNGKLLLWRL